MPVETVNATPLMRSALPTNQNALIRTNHMLASTENALLTVQRAKEMQN